MKRFSGFTIVELVVVIAVIGILAAIVTVNLNATVVRSENATRVEEVNQLKSLFELYKSRYKTYPEVALNANPNLNFYCIGEGFPTISGEQRCRDVNNATYKATVNAALNADLKKVSGGALPKVSGTLVGGALGPFVEFTSTGIRINAVIEDTSTTFCPENGLQLDYIEASAKRALCYTSLTY